MYGERARLVVFAFFQFSFFAVAFAAAPKVYSFGAH